MKTHVLTVSRVFPVTHKRNGERTHFDEKILKGLNKTELIYQKAIEIAAEFTDLRKDSISDFGAMRDIQIKRIDELTPKLHTIRANYELWSKRIEEVQEGKAILSIRYWSGKPRNSKQVEICQLDKDSGIGVQKIYIDGVYQFIIDGKDWRWDVDTIAKNDGLSKEDFKEWFRKYDLQKPMAIIHFTKFRY